MKKCYTEKADFLTVQDVKEILEAIMPKRTVTRQELLQLILEKHKARESARRSHHRRKKKTHVFGSTIPFL